MYSYKYYTTHPPANRQPPKLANADDIRPQFQVSDSLTTDQTGAFSSSVFALGYPCRTRAARSFLLGVPRSECILPVFFGLGIPRGGNRS